MFLYFLVLRIIICVTCCINIRLKNRNMLQRKIFNSRDLKVEPFGQRKKYLSSK